MRKDAWFLQLDSKEVIGQMEMMHNNYAIWSNNPVMQAWVRNTIAYNSAVLDAQGWETALSFQGDQGELVRMAVPQSRKLIRQLVTIITKNRLNFQCIARSKDGGAVEASRLANALASQEVEDKKLDKKGEKLAEGGFVQGTSFMSCVWKTDRGQKFARGDHGIIYAGDTHFRNHSVFDTFYDYEIEDWEDLPFVEIRTMANKWDLVAKYPELKQEIVSLPSIRDLRGLTYISETERAEIADDQVYVYELYVKPSPALPHGRMLIYSDDRTVYYDDRNHYGLIPIEQLKSMPIHNLGYGYPLLSDLLPCQEMLDHSFSAIASNQSAFAVQNILVPDGSNIGVNEVGGMNWIKYTPMENGGGKPEPLQLAKSAPETFKFAETLMQHMELLSDINSALRGTPPPGVTSGVAIATLTHNALEFITSGAKDYALTMENMMMHSINAHKRFAEREHFVRMTGSNQKTYDAPFTGGDLEPIGRVKMLLQSPVMQTTSGRLDIAEKMVQSGLVKRPQDYISILEGAPMDTLWDTELSENDLINTENEMLLQGEEVPVMMTDDHAGHVREHSKLLNEMEIRLNPEKWQLVLDHIMQHREQASQVDPMLEAMLRTGMMPQPQEGEIPTGEGELPPPPNPEAGMEGDIMDMGGDAATASPDALERGI